MRTIADVLFGRKITCPMSAVLVLRHGRYEMRHAIRNCIGNTFEAYARNYSRRYPDSFFPLTTQGMTESTEQGRRFVQLGCAPNRIITSANGRGPHTAICIADGVSQEAGTGFPDITHDVRADYPVWTYDGFAKLMEDLYQEFGTPDPVVAQWLNGKHPGRTAETPEEFLRRSTEFVEAYADGLGLAVIASHFELVALCHALYVVRTKLGSIDERWAPAYNQGVLIVRRRDADLRPYTEAHDVAPNLSIME